MGLSVRGLRYVARFRCIAEACEDSCCVGWQVPVDRLSYQRQRRVVEQQEPGAYDRSVAVNPQPTGDGDYAHVVLRADGSCAFLEGTRLCSLQRTAGVEALGNACASYPRVISRVGDRVEVAGSLSCPEIARLCLLADDGMEPVAFEAAELPRPYAAQTLAGGAEAIEAFVQIRAVAVRLLSDQRVPFRHRALSLVRLGTDGAASPPDEDPHGGVLMFTLVARLLQARAALPAGRRFDAVVARALSAYGVRDGVALDDGAALRAYHDRRARLEARFGVLLDRIFANYALNHWMTRWHVDRPSVAVYVHALLLRLAVVRVLLVGQPGLDDGAAVERAAVQVIQTFTKDMEHERALVDALAAGLAESPRDLVEQSLALARV